MCPQSQRRQLIAWLTKQLGAQNSSVHLGNNDDNNKINDDVFILISKVSFIVKYSFDNEPIQSLRQIAPRAEFAWHGFVSFTKATPERYPPNGIQLVRTYSTSAALRSFSQSKAYVFPTEESWRTVSAEMLQSHHVDS